MKMIADYFGYDGCRGFWGMDSQPMADLLKVFALQGGSLLPPLVLSQVLQTLWDAVIFFLCISFRR